MKNKLVSSTFQLIKSDKLSSEVEKNIELPDEVVQGLEKSNMDLPEARTIVESDDGETDEPTVTSLK